MDLSLEKNLQRLKKAAALLRGGLAELPVTVVSGTEIRLPRSAHRHFWTGEHEDRRLLQFLADGLRGGGTFFDIGANVGVYSAALRQLVGDDFRAICFEPVPTTVRVLRRTLAANDVNARIEQVALSDGPGRLQLSAFVDGANNFWVKDARPGIPVHEVPKLTLDEWMRQNPTVVPTAMKIDVEGHELAVLEGARETLSRFKPRLMVECHCASFAELGVSAERLQRVIEAVGYSSCTRADGTPLELTRATATVHACCRP